MSFKFVHIVYNPNVPNKFLDSVKMKSNNHTLQERKKEIESVKLGLFIIKIESLPIQLCCQFFAFKMNPNKREKRC